MSMHASNTHASSTVAADLGSRTDRLDAAHEDSEQDPHVRELLADVQTLLAQLAHVADPEIARMRAIVSQRLTSIRQAIGEGTASATRHAQAAAVQSDEYVRAQPWQAAGAAAITGLLVGYLIARR